MTAQGDPPIFWTWVRVVRRAELGFGEGKKRISTATVQHVAMMAATYANPDGTRIRPGVERLARVTRLDPKTVRACLARLREVGLLERVFEASKAGLRDLADEYRMAIPGDLFERVAMLDPDERELIIPDGVEAPPVKTRRRKAPGAAPAGSDEPPGAAPGAPVENVVDNPVDNPEPPGAAPAATPQERDHHRVLPPEPPGAAPRTTGCSTPPPTHRPTNHLPTHISSPYGAEVEGGAAKRREPSAKDPLPTYRQPPLLATLTNPDPGRPDPEPGAYEAARDTLATLPDLGSALIAEARAELGDGTPLTALVIRAHQLAQERRPA